MSFKSPLFLQLPPLPCCHGYTFFSLESKKRGGGQECEKERGCCEWTGGRKRQTAQMRSMQRGKDGGAEGRKPSRRDKRLQTNTGGSFMFSGLWQQIPAEYCWFHYQCQNRYLTIADTDGTGGKFAVGVIFRPGLIGWIYLQLSFAPLIQREEGERNSIIWTWSRHRRPIKADSNAVCLSPCLSVRLSPKAACEWSF